MAVWDLQGARSTPYYVRSITLFFHWTRCNNCLGCRTFRSAANPTFLLYLISYNFAHSQRRRTWCCCDYARTRTTATTSV